MSVSVLLHQVSGAESTEEIFIREAVAMLREAVRTPGFGGSVRQAVYSSAGWQGRHGKIHELDGDEVWERIVQGRECGNTADHALNLAIEIHDLPDPASGKAVIGRTRLGSLPIRSARWFLDRCIAADDPVNYAAHLMHQWMHVSGFVHRVDDDGKDAPSVLARLVRRTLEPAHGDRIDARLTAIVTLTDGECACSAVDDGVTAAQDARAA